MVWSVAARATLTSHNYAAQMQPYHAAMARLGSLVTASALCTACAVRRPEDRAPSKVAESLWSPHTNSPLPNATGR